MLLHQKFESNNREPENAGLFAYFVTFTWYINVNDRNLFLGVDML